MSLCSIEDFAVALKGIDLSSMPIMIDAGSATVPVMALLLAHLRQQELDPAVLRGGIVADPLSEWAATGKLPRPLPNLLDELSQLTHWAGRHTPNLSILAVQTNPYHDAGANAVQELALALATGVFYLRALNERGVDIETAAGHMRFDFAIGPQFFMEIAKLRTARLLWSQVVAAFGGSETAQRMTIHARTGSYNKTLTDASVNMVRVTTEALSAVLGGVDSLHVSPFDEPAGTQDPFSRHIARNVQAILQDEVQLTRVVDPAGGTWAIESLSSSLAQDAWTFFQTIEAQGGIEEVLRSGFIQSEIAAVRASRQQSLATRKSIVRGYQPVCQP